MQTLTSTKQLGRLQIVPNRTATRYHAPKTLFDVQLSYTTRQSSHILLSAITLRHRGVDRRRNVAVKASEEPFQFEEGNYHRMNFLDAPYGPLKIYHDPKGGSNFTGVMVFKRTIDSMIESSTRILEVFVAGDTAVNIFTLVNNQKLERPMVHDVMYSIMEKAMSENCRQWTLLKVAIVGLQNDVFVGRLFFGDPLTGKVHWDCDCRPSDGCFLSIKCKAPLYVHKKVWELTSKPINMSTIHQMLKESSKLENMQQITSSSSQQQQQQQLSSIVSAQQQQQQQHAQASALSALGDSSHLPQDYMVLMDDDLEAIKLLKRKLAVAIKEEDYKAATSIRDHPFLLLYKELFSQRIRGHKDEAARLESELKHKVAGHMFSQEFKL
ncbi:hypothetical protein CEUSTIGMA_g7133.t1 [Chlamydomonas eustigma]|uniref:BFN domain-containing protein n=1 Tax=Chlamydomonas eustigma TaxID=1157962 RepID=A0A250XA07_9CHLO|nr:hypothetical protein CEUSTIGMA_g7133.t1 [Chlamydomonas eustigma]|eukprot:GAX79692.1 hypothetical protein CEUSTIGMA_g7133.t1 [Chlamydomonas eustigma]